MAVGTSGQFLDAYTRPIDKSFRDLLCCDTLPVFGEEVPNLCARLQRGHSTFSLHAQSFMENTGEAHSLRLRTCSWIECPCVRMPPSMICRAYIVRPDARIDFSCLYYNN